MTVPTALITGASGGIGSGIARALADAGFGIAANDLMDSAALHAVVAELRAIGVAAVPVVGDVANPADHERMLDDAEAGIGPLTTLVNNAGVSVMVRGDLLEVTAESYDRCQAVNARGMFFLSQAFSRRLLARRRPADVHHSIVNVTSSNAVAASINRGEYCVSKAAASMATRLFAVRLGAENIGVYEIQPGVIATPMTAGALDVYRKRIEDGLTLTPYVGEPADIGRVALAFASGQLSYCTGQAIQADAGLLVPRF